MKPSSANPFILHFGLNCVFGLLVGSLLLVPATAPAEIDFSTCGYRQSSVPVPNVPAVVRIEAADGDDGALIQAAIDHISNLAPDAEGFRGAVLLAPGEFEVADQLVIDTSGVVLRGSGIDQTRVRAIGHSRRPLIRVLGRGDRVIDGEEGLAIVDEKAPAGAITLTVEGATALKPGDSILITRPSTAEWIKEIGMDRFGISWKPGSRDIRWERTITGIDRDEHTIEIDAPITTAIESRWGGGKIETFLWPGRIQNIGVENFELISEPSTNNVKDEDHAWCGITMENAANAWVRQVTFRKFAGSAVALWESTRAVTVVDCISIEPVSEIGGYRRHTFFTMGQQTLFLRCWSENGRHDFSVGHCAPGPNAFVACQAMGALDFSGPIESWASGVLYDNCRIDGAGINFVNRWVADQAVGWCAANSTIWQSNAAEIRCFNPDTATNRAVGVWSRYIGDGIFENEDSFVKPRSLFQSQLEQRLGSGDAAAHLGPIGQETGAATNPSPPEVERFVAAANEPPESLRQIIEAASIREAIPVTTNSQLTTIAPVLSPVAETRRPASINNGRVYVGNEQLRGKCFTPTWWRGSIRPEEAPSFGPAISRFVPGRIGMGFTDDLGEVADAMQASGAAVFEHHYGLWYDRRRDDHIRERRPDGNVSPPFYEQPFARSGQGTAWDGLSKYDLTKFNPWYWNRLKDFAGLCDQRGLILFHQHYFQHNILEAGAHWADCPWRSANNINSTGFPEPPPYASDKRIFQAHLFYDADQAHRREFHRAYIRQCLNNTASNTNVVHSISAEYTGPLEFTQFWIDTIVEWERETGNDALVCLSCTKDVQDAILADPLRGPAISIIDIRYWWYSSNGDLYAPPGGMNLSPRQHARQLRPKSPSPESTKRAVAEYRGKFPDKAVWFNGQPVE
ncbi:MAG: pectate lyase [Verrucomicrobiae bacterium]|nr:pectate lyase [Verrucomicrobiae bacterium]